MISSFNQNLTNSLSLELKCNETNALVQKIEAVLAKKEQEQKMISLNLGRGSELSERMQKREEKHQQKVAELENELNIAQKKKSSAEFAKSAAEMSARFAKENQQKTAEILEKAKQK